MIRLIAILLIITNTLSAQIITRKYVVQVDDQGNTIPPNTMATPQQISKVTDRAMELEQVYDGLHTRMVQCTTALTLLSTNRIVTSTVYVQSIGGIPHDPSKQTIKITSMEVTDDNIEIIAEVEQQPLIPLVLDWRLQLLNGQWTEIPASITPMPQPNPPAVAAYKFTLPKQPQLTGFYRIVDNSTGVSGSGLYWLVFGCIVVDGKRGFTGTIDTHRWVGGILVEPDAIGSF